MNRERTTKNRKRRVDFDISSTLIPLPPKQRRVRDFNMNREGKNSGQITDLSKTIITDRPSTSTNMQQEVGT